MNLSFRSTAAALAIGILVSSCSAPVIKPGQARTIALQPLGDFPMHLANAICCRLRKENLNIILKQKLPLPSAAYYHARNRYRADSLLHYLSRESKRDEVVIGLTSKDISTTKGGIADWGIMGLGNCPGTSCVVSSFRLANHNLVSQLYKVVIHEFGHTQGLPHCKQKNCFMRDAAGGNHLDEETDFCPRCKSFLEKKGWKFNLSR